MLDWEKFKTFMRDLRFAFKFAVFGIAAYALVVWIKSRG